MRSCLRYTSSGGHRVILRRRGSGIVVGHTYSGLIRSCLFINHVSAAGEFVAGWRRLEGGYTIGLLNFSPAIPDVSVTHCSQC